MRKREILNPRKNFSPLRFKLMNSRSLGHSRGVAHRLHRATSCGGLSRITAVVMSEVLDLEF